MAIPHSSEPDSSEPVRSEPAPVDDGLWSIESSLRFLTARVPARTTLIRLADGTLLAYSPTAFSEELRKAIEPLGRVAHLVAPSLYHHMYLGEWIEAFPEARTYGAPGLAAKRSDLHFDEELSDEAPAAWAAEIDQVVFRGLPIFNEVEFFHRPTRTLILCDLVFHIHDADNWKDRLILQLDGMWKRFGASHALKLAMLRYRMKSREGVDAIASWDFDRVIPAHGEILEAGGKAAITEAFRFLGASRSPSASS